MPSFICEKCGAVDNSTSRNNFWSQSEDMDEEYKFEDDWFNHHKACSACCPKYRKDGSVFNLKGWNCSYERKHWTEYGRENLLKNRGVWNAESYFEAYDKGEVLESSREKYW